jgi:D-alanyl-D-alanine carboxypeptidase (penicillin-binding protein 5/6)
LGAYQSTIKNTNGLPLEGHLMSAYDLGILARYAMKNRRFREIVSTKYVVIGDNGQTRELKNTNKLLWQREDIIGIKTGTTDDAGACLVAASNQNGLLLIAVVLHSPNRYRESLELLDYGASEYQSVYITDKEVLTGYLPVKNGKKQVVSFTAINDGFFFVQISQRPPSFWQLPEYVSAPVKKGEPMVKFCSRIVMVISGKDRSESRYGYKEKRYRLIFDF